ncbi:MAG: urea ABC transporter permease subunit UrtB [Pseudomonadota bacterium]|nr:urea ABC transporter permease subunit UrtB [Pseudomonadota bacterium]
MRAAFSRLSGRMQRLLSLLIFPALLLSPTLLLSVATQANTLSLAEVGDALIDANLRQKAPLVEQLLSIEDDDTLRFAQTLLEGDLYYRKADRLLLTKDDDDLQAFFTQEPVEISSKRAIKKISVNNRLRIQLRAGIARMQIFASSEATRLTAAQSLLKSADDIDIATLNEAIEQETSPKVSEVLALVVGLKQLQSDNDYERRMGIDALSGSLYPEVRGALSNFIRDCVAGGLTKDAALAAEAMEKIETRLKINSVIENLYFGLALGAVLLLAAIGLAITFGVMGVINMAHGEMIMLGAYTTYVVQQLMPDHIGMSLVIAIPAAFVVSGLVGIAIERGVIRHLYGRPLETLLATFGISLILQQAVRSIFSPLNREVATPEWMAGTFSINPALALTYNRLYIIIFSLLVLALLALILKRTLFGLQMRAVTMNRPMASSMGIRTGWVDALTFGLGSGIAGIAGVALSQLTNVGPNMGQAYIIDSFMVVVFGGVGNLWGTLVGAMSLGVVNKILEPWAGAVVAKILVLVFIILFIQKRPRGLFALKGRAAEMG